MSKCADTGGAEVIPGEGGMCKCETEENREAPDKTGLESGVSATDQVCS